MSTESMDRRVRKTRRQLRECLISLLKEKGVIAPGEYFVSVAVNNNKISNGQKINWQKKGDKTIPCINDSLVDKFGLKPDIRKDNGAVRC